MIPPFNSNHGFAVSKELIETLSKFELRTEGGDCWCKGCDLREFIGNSSGACPVYKKYGCETGDNFIVVGRYNSKADAPGALAYMNVQEAHK